MKHLGYVLLAHARNLTEALAANKVIYLGGCFLQLIILLVVCTLCGIRLGRVGRILKTLGFAVGATIYIFVLNPMRSGDFYRHTELLRDGGLPYLQKEYGWMHSVFQGVVLFYYFLSLTVIVYCFIRKNQISRKILVLLLLPETLAIAAFFIGQKALGHVEFLLAVYVMAQVVYLIIVSRISLYDISDTAIDSMMKKGDTGFL